MAKPPTPAERADFTQFCRQATDTQVRNILHKERAASRFTYANIARKELEQRGLQE